ncbi:hypothetical protein AXF42_Ash009068 [Apostasia shenzhenica]|uniref:Uncharacterized protein n=1 Tax=Apostasia shenzhenica TaxID=1088818 RepID=A0A2I0ADD9_9ASPA|nr:hypothetical protein AXF42_Ash009068 [Apostasia shenzhenica]
MAPLPSPAPPPAESPQDALLSSAFGFHSKPPLPDPFSAAAAAADRLLRSFASAVGDMPLLGPLFSVSSDIRTFLSQAIYGEILLVWLGWHLIFPFFDSSARLVAETLVGIAAQNRFITLPQFCRVTRTLCDPYLNIFRGLIPPIGGTLDLSPILAFMVLNVFNSTAAALPAELSSQPSASPLPFHQNLTSAQEKPSYKSPLTCCGLRPSFSSSWTGLYSAWAFLAGPCWMGSTSGLHLDQPPHEWALVLHYGLGLGSQFSFPSFGHLFTVDWASSAGPCLELYYFVLESHHTVRGTDPPASVWFVLKPHHNTGSTGPPASVWFILEPYHTVGGLKRRSNLGYAGSVEHRPRRFRITPSNINDDVPQLHLSQSAWSYSAVFNTKRFF